MSENVFSFTEIYFENHDKSTAHITQAVSLLTLSFYRKIINN